MAHFIALLIAVSLLVTQEISSSALDACISPSCPLVRIAENTACFQAAGRLGAFVAGVMPTLPENADAYKENLQASSCLLAAMLMNNEKSAIKIAMRLAGIPSARTIFRRFAQLTARGNRDTVNLAEFVGTVIDGSPFPILEAAGNLVNRSEEVKAAIDRLKTEANIRKPLGFVNNAAKIFCELGTGIKNKLGKRVRTDDDDNDGERSNGCNNDVIGAEHGGQTEPSPDRPAKRRRFRFW